MPDTVSSPPSRRNVIKIKPPLTITEQELDRALDVFEEQLQCVSKMGSDGLEQIRQKMIREAKPER